jgi:3-oxoacyl-[acyl-carrier protein] reductase
MTEPHRPAALITGAGRLVGIAAGIAQRLADDGWNLALSYWRPYDADMAPDSGDDEPRQLADDLRARGATVLLLPGDLTVPSEPDRLVAEGASLGRLRGLVLSHAESRDSAILDTTVESFDRHMAVNARASWQLVAAFARQIPDGGGAIVALTSDHTAWNLPYGASKGALDRIVIAAARELGHLGIRANVVNPGPVDTGWMNDDIRAEVARSQPTGRIGTPADVARLVAFLLSDDGVWTTGQLIHSDGGYSA